RDREAVNEPAGKTGHRRLVPDGQPPAPGDLPDVGLAKAAFDERASDRTLPRRFHAGPIVAQIVDVRAVRDHGDAQRLLKAFQVRVQLRLAVVAAVARVGDVAGTREFFRVDGDVPDADRLGQFASLAILFFGET